MENIFANPSHQFGEDVVNNIAGALGITPETTQSAIAAAVPAIAAAMSGKAAQPDGAARLQRTFGFLTSMGSSHPKTMLSGLLNDERAMNAGANMARSLFGDAFNATVEKLAAQTGVSEEIASKLLSMAVPAVMGAIGTQVKQKGMDAAGLVTFFNEADKPQDAAPDATDENTANPDAAQTATPSEATSIAESLKRGLKKLFGRA